MPEYLIHPKAPLLFRNAKPFASGEGGAETLPFPSPATISGALRTTWAEQQGLAYTAANAEMLRSKQVLGPLLVSERANHRTLLFPTPCDSLCLRNDDNQTLIHRIAPEPLREGEGCDLPHDALLPLHLKCGANKKPAQDAPAFWYQERLVEWLVQDASDALPAQGQGVGALPIEYRTHVSVKPDTYTAKDAHLFESAGVDFSPQQLNQAATADVNTRGWRDEQFALLARFQHDGELRNSYRTVGGEARLGFIESADTGLWPSCPEALENELKNAKYFRLYLATPAIFCKGWLPEFITKETLRGEWHGLKVKLRAAAIPRWEAGTSWDMTKSKGSKGMRTAQRMVPAGAVYWFEIEGDATAASLCKTWLTSISDQREKDGFGLVLPGVWNPQPVA